MKSWKTKSGYEITNILSGRSNVFLLSNGKTNILIDTSVPNMWNALQNTIDKLNIKSIDYLILTHSHFDHTSNAKKVKEKYNACVIIHKDERDYLSKGYNDLPGGTNIRIKIMLKLLGGLFYKFSKFDPCEPDILVDSVYDLKDTGFNAYLLHTPGHSAGSISLIIDDEIAIVGDAMFGIKKHSVFPPFAYDIELMINSWGRLLETNCKLFIPSHGTENPRSLVQKDYDNRIKEIHSAES